MSWTKIMTSQPLFLKPLNQEGLELPILLTSLKLQPCLLKQKKNLKKLKALEIMY